MCCLTSKKAFHTIADFPNINGGNVVPPVCEARRVAGWEESGQLCLYRKEKGEIDTFLTVILPMHAC